MIPVRIFFEGQDNLPQYFDGKLNPFLFFLPFFAFLSFKKNTPMIKAEKKILLAFAVLYLLFAFFKTDMRIRYIAPIIPPLVILAMYGLHQISTFVAGYFSAPVRRLYYGWHFGDRSIYVWYEWCIHLGAIQLC